MKGEMIERVAKAAYESTANGWGDIVVMRGPDEDWEMLRPELKEPWLITARASIAAMREPTEEMMAEDALITVGDSEYHASDDVLYSLWRRQIDEALR